VEFVNCSSAPATVESMVLAGADPGDFLVDGIPGKLPQVVAPAGRLWLRSSFAPMRTGDLMASLTVGVTGCLPTHIYLLGKGR